MQDPKITCGERGPDDNSNCDRAITYRLAQSWVHIGAADDFRIIRPHGLCTQHAYELAHSLGAGQAERLANDATFSGTECGGVAGAACYRESHHRYSQRLTLLAD